MTDLSGESALAALVASSGLIDAEIARRANSLFSQTFPATGPLARDGYRKHLALMRAGAAFQQRMALMANRAGKTRAAGYETTCHLTGLYPDWWDGRRFEGPIEAWASGDTSLTTRDIIQVELLGPLANIDARRWAGMIPPHLVVDVSRRTGVQDAIETVWVRHVSGGTSILNLKSYDQKRQAFQGTAKHLIWLDEEPPGEIHQECLMRLMTTNGLLLVTMTPLQGLTPFINEWLDRAVLETLDEAGESALVPAKSGVFKPSEGATEAKQNIEDLARYVVMAGWDDAPHLSPEAKRAMAREYQPAQLAARSKGIPALGAGAIYPIPEDEIRVAPFEIPKHWPRCYGLDTASDVGWTACAWLAHDREAQVLYIYDVYKRQHAEPSLHAASILARGKWIPGVGDASGVLMTEHDSQQFITIYRNLGLDIDLPDKAVESGIQAVWELLSAGRLKVFASCGAFFDEYRLYRRDDKGRIVKKDDHLLDGVRYGVVSGIHRAKVQPVPVEPVTRYVDPMAAGQSWMA